MTIAMTFVVPYFSSARPAVQPRASLVRLSHAPGWSPAGGWTGQTAATVEVTGVDIAALYRTYSDVSRMPEWSSLLDSVTVDSDAPENSLWAMRIPRPLIPIARGLGYSLPGGSERVMWEAVLDAPGPPIMRWTSLMREVGGVQNAGFLPEGMVSFVADGPHRCRMTVELTYTLPEPAAKWKVALVDNPVVQKVIRNRLVSGMNKFVGKMRVDEEEKAKQREAEQKAT